MRSLTVCILSAILIPLPAASIAATTTELSQSSQATVGAAEFPGSEEKERILAQYLTEDREATGTEKKIRETPNLDGEWKKPGLSGGA